MANETKLQSVELEDLLDLDYFKQKVTDNVTEVLKTHFETRDSDERLVAVYYYKFYPKLIKEGTALDFVKALAQGKVANPDLITRTRRKLQEHNVELRGEKWHERRRKQSEVKSDLKQTKAFRRAL